MCIRDRARSERTRDQVSWFPIWGSNVVDHLRVAPNCFEQHAVPLSKTLQPPISFYEIFDVNFSKNFEILLLPVSFFLANKCKPLVKKFIYLLTRWFILDSHSFQVWSLFWIMLLICVLPHLKTSGSFLAETPSSAINSECSLVTECSLTTFQRYGEVISLLCTNNILYI